MRRLLDELLQVRLVRMGDELAEAEKKVTRIREESKAEGERIRSGRYGYGKA